MNISFSDTEGAKGCCEYHWQCVFKKDFGSILALTYNNSNSTTISDRREFEEQGDIVQKTRDFKDTTFSNIILASVLWNLSYKLNDNNQLGFKKDDSIQEIITAFIADDLKQNS